MIAAVFEPSRAFIARLEIEDADELPEKLQELLTAGKRIPMRSYVELPGQTLSVVGFNPIRLEERKMPTVVEIPATHARHLRRNSRQTAQRQMIVGGLWFVGGLIVTIGSFLAALNGTMGGAYLVAWGAIFFGLFRFFRGLAAFRNG